jgi:hypothetical protein
MAGRPLRMVLAGDNTGAIKAIAGVQTQMGHFTAALAGLPSKGSSAFKGMGSAISASGIAGQFGELQTMLGNLSGAFNTMGEKGKTSFGKIVTGVGVAAAAAGGIGLMASKPLQDANAQLKQSIENQGGTWDEFAGKIGSADKKMEKLGHTNADTNAALSTLTQAFNDPEKALAQLNLTSDIAARNHTSLAEAAGTVIKVHAGSTRALKAYGINVKDTTDLGKAATKAEKEQTIAHDKLTAAQLRQSNLKARLGASGDTKDLATQKKVATAQDALAKAGLHLQSVQASITAGHKKGAAAATELQAAQAGVTTASKKLDDAQAASLGTTKLSVAQQQELTKANKDVGDAQKKVTETDKAAVATKGDLDKGSISEAVALQMLTDKTKGLAAAQADTFGGKLRAIKADVTDFAAHVGQQYGGMLITAGPALAGIGGLIQSNIIGKAKEVVVAVGTFGLKMAGFSKEVLADGTVMRTGWAADMLGISTASEMSAGATILAWSAVLVPLAALGVALKFASDDWTVTWIGMKTIAQVAVNGVLEVVGWLLTGIADIEKGLANMLEMASKVPVVGGKFKGMAASARQGEQDLTQWAANLHKGIDITSADVAKYQADQAKKAQSKLDAAGFASAGGAGSNADLAALLGTGALVPLANPAVAPGSSPLVPAGVVNYNDAQSITMHGVTIQTSDPVDLGRQLADATARGNLSGDGVGGVSHRSGQQP